MKKEFSTKWKGSRQPRKQRKYIANAPRHLARRRLSAHLSKELRAKYSRRSFVLRKGDNIKVMTGKYAGKEGKVNDLDFKNYKVAIEGLQVTKKEGSKVNIWFDASKLLVKELALDDKKRLDSVQRNMTKKVSEIKQKEGKK